MKCTWKWFPNFQEFLKNKETKNVYRITLENFEEFLKNKEIKNMLKDVLIEEDMEHI